MDWIEPMFRRDGDGPAIIVGPPELAGRKVEEHAGGPVCGLENDHWSPVVVCGLVAGHEGDHWRCAKELVEHAGPFKVLEAEDAAGR